MNRVVWITSCVVVPDVTGSPMGNTMCMDSRLGAAESYLTQDVTKWLQTDLQADTSHYLGPVVTFNIPRGPSVRFSPNFGLNDNSNGFLFRFMISYEIEQVFSRLKK